VAEVVAEDIAQPEPPAKKKTAYLSTVVLATTEASQVTVMELSSFCTTTTLVGAAIVLGKFVLFDE
jgi:hypothetical protein